MLWLSLEVQIVSRLAFFPFSFQCHWILKIAKRYRQFTSWRVHCGFNQHVCVTRGIKFLIFLFSLFAVVVVAEATPKVVRTRMGVEGLTLYHLKSHLQVSVFMYMDSWHLAYVCHWLDKTLHFTFRHFLWLRGGCALLGSEIQAWQAASQRSYVDTSGDGETLLLAFGFLLFS